MHSQLAHKANKIKFLSLVHLGLKGTLYVSHLESIEDNMIYVLCYGEIYYIMGIRVK